MPTPTAAAPDALVVAVLPASAARLAAEELGQSVRDAKDDADPIAARLEEALGALHDAGWSPHVSLDDACAELNRRGDSEGRYVDTTSVHLHGDLADALLTARGWTIESLPVPTSRKSNTGGVIRGTAEERAYVKPGGTPRAQGGQFGVDYLWHRDEALTLALVAEALS